MAGAFDPQQHAKALLEGFTGRQWLVDEVVKWRDDPSAPRYLLITGEPGIGKSAFAAHLWLEQRIVHVCHFCIGSMDSTLLPANFVESLRDQLAAGLPDFQQALDQSYEAPPPVNIQVQVQTGPVHESDLAGVRMTLYIEAMPPAEAFDRYIRRPLCRLAEKNGLPPLVILVDALDEAIAKPEPHILSLLLGADDLPKAVRFVLTSRDVAKVRKALRGKPHQVICADDPRNQEDVQEFLRKQWEMDEKLRAQVSRWDGGWDGERFVAFLAARSEWNFLYLRQILPLIAEDRVPDPNQLPFGMKEDFYTYLLQQCITDSEWKGWGQPLMRVALALQEPGTAEQIADILGWYTDETLSRLGQLSPLWSLGHRQNGRYWRHHWSLVEFLGNPQKAQKDGEDWYCDLRAGHERIAEYYLRLWGGLADGLPGLVEEETRRRHDGYGLRSLVPHLMEAGRGEDVLRLLRLERDGKHAWFEALDAEGLTAFFVRDVGLAWQYVGQQNAERIREGRPAERLGEEIRLALITASVNSLSANLPPALLAALVKYGIWSKEKALAYARQVPATDGRALALAALAPHLPENLRRQALQDALAAAQTIQDEDDRAQALAAIAPHLPPDLLPDTLAAARAIQRERYRAQVLAGLAGPLSQLPLPELYPLWRETLPVLAARRRRDILRDLAALKEVILALGGETALQETVRAISDVSRWWP